MKKNIGIPGRLFRFAIAIALFALAFYKQSWLVGLAALFVLYESLAGWCVLYQILGKNSCPK